MPAAKNAASPLPVQERLRDMQSLLILKNIRGDHDSDPTVLGALDHAISIIQKRVDKAVEQAADDFKVNFLRDVVPLIERGAASITNFGVERDVERISLMTIDGQGPQQLQGRSQFTYTISIVSSENIVR